MFALTTINVEALRGIPADSNEDIMGLHYGLWPTVCFAMGMTGCQDNISDTLKIEIL